MVKNLESFTLIYNTWLSKNTMRSDTRAWLFVMEPRNERLGEKKKKKNMA